jgi:hypothetical protein
MKLFSEFFEYQVLQLISQAKLYQLVSSNMTHLRLKSDWTLGLESQEQFTGPSDATFLRGNTFDKF